MNRENVMREALSDLEAQRASNIETERQRREEARAKSAEIAAFWQDSFYSGLAYPHARKKTSKNALFSVRSIFADEKPTATRLV